MCSSDLPDRRAWLDTMPGSEVPVLRQPFEPGDRRPLWAGGEYIVGRHHCYDLAEDSEEQRNLVGTAIEAEMLDLLRTALLAVDAPGEQFARLGLDR